MCPLIENPGTAVSINVLKPEAEITKSSGSGFANFTWVTRQHVHKRCQRRRFGLAAVTIADLPLRGAARGSLRKIGQVLTQRRKSLPMDRRAGAQAAPARCAR